MRDANDIARDYERRERTGQDQPVSQALAAPRRGRVIGVYSQRHDEFDHGHEPGEDLIAENASFRILGNDTAVVEDDEHTYLLNLRAYRFIEFWVDPEANAG